MKVKKFICKEVVSLRLGRMLTHLLHVILRDLCNAKLFRQNKQQKKNNKKLSPQFFVISDQVATFQWSWAQNMTLAQPISFIVLKKGKTFPAPILLYKEFSKNLPLIFQNCCAHQYLLGNKNSL